MSLTRRAFTKHVVERHFASTDAATAIFEELSRSTSTPSDPNLQREYLCSSPRRNLTQLPKIQELPCIDLRKCPKCPFLSPTSEGVRRHMRRQHENLGPSEMSRTFSKSLDIFRGQTFWTRPGWRQYWIVKEFEPARRVGSGALADIKSAAKFECSGEEDALENVVTYERTPFGNLTRLDKVLKRVGLSWEMAVRLTGGARVVDEYIDTNCTTYVSTLFRDLMAEGRNALESSAAWLNTAPIMRAVATPGATQKNRQFYIRIVETENRYASHCTRVILMILRMWVLQRTPGESCALPRLSKEMDEAVTRLVDLIPENCDEDAGCETEHSSAPSLNAPLVRCQERLSQAKKNTLGCQKAEWKMT